jgi:hypothetical protein
LPTARTTVGRREWRWGKPVDPPSNSGPPLIMGPSALEPDRRGDDEHTPSIRDVIERMKR